MYLYHYARVSNFSMGSGYSKLITPNSVIVKYPIYIIYYAGSASYTWNNNKITHIIS